MTAEVQKDGNDLTLILGRVNALMGEVGDKAVPAGAAVEETVPLLTDVYVGKPLAFTIHRVKEPQGHPPIEGSSDAAQPESRKDVERLLAEMLPLIREEVKKAVLQELAKVDETLCAKLEEDLLKSLHERLQTPN